MKVLVTGGSGFVGRHLVRSLEERGHEVVATTTREEDVSPRCRALRLPDTDGCAALLVAMRPGAVVHLAGISSVADAERDPALAVATNLEGTLSVCRALDAADPSGSVRLVHVSSGHVYAMAAAGENVLDESSPVGPSTAYGRTKLAAELVVEALVVPRRPGVTFRPFNHLGPGQRADFALSSFARQIAEAERGRREPVLEVGDLAVRRDFLDVRDVVLAYALAVEGQVPPGTYNLASGASTSLEELLDAMRRLARVPIAVRVAAERLRPGEPRSVRGVARKIQAACGWRPKVSLSETVERMLEGWRQGAKDAG